MKILISYDVSVRNEDLKTELLENGFFDKFRIVRDTMVCLLPESTLWHPDLSSTDEAKDVFLNIIDFLNKDITPENIIVIKRFIAVDFTTASGVPGDSEKT